MTPAEHLRAARKLITPDGAWTQKAAARDSAGSKVDPASPLAECWCVFGAVRRFGQSASAWDALRKVIGPPISFNDTPGRTQAEVLAAFDTAIELAGARS